ncbi:MAG: secretin N-terminal domain-containing protein [Nibricoccus sp.]
MRTRMLKTTLLVSAMLPISGVVALAQDAATPPPPAKTEATAVAPAQPAAPAETKPLVSKGKDTLTVDFPDTEIREVLRNVADMFELNLVIPETLQGKTSIKLRDVTWRQVYQVVLQPVGYTIVEEGNIIRVVTQESLNLEPLTTEVFILNYAKASEIKPSLDSLVDSKVGGKIVVDARSNALVVTERGSVMQKLKPIVQNLDRPTEQVMIESKFIEVTNADIKNVGVNWASLGGYKVGGSVNRNYLQTNGRVNTNQHTEKNIDVPFMQNGYERTDTLLNRNYPNSPAGSITDMVNGPNGINQPGRGVGPEFDDTTGAVKDTGPSSELSNLFTNNISRLTNAVFSAGQFDLIISALQTQNDTKLVSNPTVVTLNNTEAAINMGDEIPIPNFTYNQEQGVFQISGFTYKPVGIILKVTPQVNNAGFIKLSVEPEVSSTDPTKDKIFGSAQLPVITTRKAKTQVTMKDGYTLGIGGMIQKADSKGQSKVPVLGNIPGLGRLFRSDSKNTQATNLVIFLTAKTIKPDGGDTGEVFDPRMIRQMEIQKNDLPGYRDGSDPYFTPPPPEPKKKGWFNK